MIEIALWAEVAVPGRFLEGILWPATGSTGRQQHYEQSREH
jgi:hypothetical protein